jgi:hypothetical protein
LLYPALTSEIKKKALDDDSFHGVWLQLSKTIQPTSIERFEDLKATVKACHLSHQYAVKNLEALTADYQKDARELTMAGQYNHNLTVTMLKTSLFFWLEELETKYRFPLRSTKQELDQALLDIGYKKVRRPCSHGCREIDVPRYLSSS